MFLSYYISKQSQHKTTKPEKCTIGGVGLFLSLYALKSLNSIEKITSRITVANFNEVINFYNDLSSLVRFIPKHSILIIGGDMNAQLGHDSPHHKYSFHQTSNQNGEHLEHFLIENKPMPEHLFSEETGKEVDLYFPKDRLIMNKKWINSCHNCEAYNTFFGASSDHRVVTAKLQVSLRTSRPLCNWAILTYEKVRNDFTIKFRNRFDALQDANEDHKLNTTYLNFV
uniref:Endonuclease/exonuclease/phosphatase domain-containing protein n=1 Tax=Octopus bimaculoides TaxID=37653 RepID=A0A0L8IFX9_OCTBM